MAMKFGRAAFLASCLGLLAIMQPACFGVRQTSSAGEKLETSAVASSNSSAAFITETFVLAFLAFSTVGFAAPPILGGIARHGRVKRWQKVSLGCNRQLEVGVCEATLLQGVCELAHPGVEDITAENACDKAWPGNRKKEANHMYCLAVARDPSLLRSAGSIHEKQVATPTVAQCKVKDMPHLKKSILEEKGSASVLSSTDLQISPELVHEVVSTCQKLNEQPLEERGADSGFCGKPSGEGQDCYFAEGIREQWSESYGKAFCNQVTGAAQWRCLAFRKQLIRIAQAHSLVGWARGSKFEDLVQFSPSSCPSETAPPADQIDDTPVVSVDEWVPATPPGTPDMI